MHKGFWPEGKAFAFTVVDDTDNSTITNLKPVYDLLYKHNLLTTKTVWVYPSRNRYKGDCLQNEAYKDFVLELQKKGFEIGLHNAGSGEYKRAEIQAGLKAFEHIFGQFPKLHINHGFNPDNIYWGYKRYGKVLGFFFKHFSGGGRNFYGEDSNSDVFWGDEVKKHIKYIRNRVFNGINTLKYDPKMPYIEKNKSQYSNYWFSSSDGHTVKEFNCLISPENITKLEQENGLCIVYTHFASHFVDNNGEVNAEFQSKIKALSRANGWFAPASTILDYLLQKQIESKSPHAWYIFKLDMKWLWDRIVKKIRFNR